MSKQMELYEKLSEANTLQEVQEYTRQVIELRGFDQQEIEKTMLMMTEEVGELAKAIRKDATDLRTDKSKLSHYDTIESEVADTFIVLLSICNKLNIDLFKAVKEKEIQNCQRQWTK